MFWSSSIQNEPQKTNLILYEHEGRTNQATTYKKKMYFIYSYKTTVLRTEEKR